MLATLAGDLTISDTTAKKLLADLPADLDPERRAVVETACRLVGKVNYFWGGKSLVIGWDSRWGELRQVTAAGSSTTDPQPGNNVAKTLTPASDPASVPTLGEWALWLLSALLGGFALMGVRRQRQQN